MLWDHVIAGWTTSHGRSWIPLEIVRDWITGPLAITQDLGFLGVTIFFLLSGYVISEVAVRERRFTFAVRRLLRIYPALIASVLVILALAALRPMLGLDEERFGTAQSLWAMTLLNYIRSAEGPVNGVAWSLIIEVLFYLLVFACLGLLKKRPLLAVCAELSIVLIVLLSARDFPLAQHRPNWFLVAASMAYLPLLILGQSVWLWRTRRAGLGVSVGIAALAWLLFVLGMRRIHTDFLEPANSYGVSVALAIGIFVLAIVNEDRIRLPHWIAALSVISYSVYLVHGPVTVIVMDWLDPKVPFTVNVVVALIVMGAMTACLWRLVEVPSQQLARRLTAPAKANDASARPGGTSQAEGRGPTVKRQGRWHRQARRPHG